LEGCNNDENIIYTNDIKIKNSEKIF
jgi:hypothetical protein